MCLFSVGTSDPIPAAFVSDIKRIRVQQQRSRSSIMFAFAKDACTMKASMALLLAMLLMFMPITTASAASVLSTPVAVTATNAAGAVQTISGVLNISSFAVRSGQLVAIGTLEFLLNGVQQVVRVVVPITNVTGTCTILDLTIGPIDLNLLGLRIQTNAIHLKITAEQGAGNLLGNLLCAVANLLNPGGFSGLTGGVLSQLSNLLNQILGAL
jgi:hypothetical protein